MLNRSLMRLILIPAALAMLEVPCGFAAGSEYYFPQVVDGVTETGASYYTSSFLLSNPQTKSNQVTIRFTLSSSLPWLIDLRCLDRPELAGRLATRTFFLNAGESVLLFTGGVDPISQGWAKVEASLPLIISEVFDFIGPPPTLQVKSEAGVLPAPLTTQFSFSVAESNDEPASGTNIDTGFALVNPGTSVAQIKATIYSRFGTFLSDRLITLLPGYQTAQFVSQLFNNINLDTVGRHGRVRFSSNVNLAVLALRQTYGNSSTLSTVSVSPDADIGAGSLFDREPNDTRATAQPVGALPATVVGTINSAGDGQDVDTYSVSLKAGTVLYVVLLTDIIGSPLDGALSIQDVNGNPQFLNTFPTGLKGPILIFPVPADGTYYIAITSQNNSFGRGAYYRMLLTAR